MAYGTNLGKFGGINPGNALHEYLLIKKYTHKHPREKLFTQSRPFSVSLLLTLLLKGEFLKDMRVEQKE